MNILGFDCAGPVLSVGLSAGGAFFQAEADGGQKHSGLVMDMADFLLKTAGLEAENLDAAACMKGPGSFTGIRIGFAAAKGIALARGIPAAAVPTLDCMALSYSGYPGIVMPLIDAKKNAFFAALYRDGRRLTPYLDADAETLRAALRENRRETGERIFLTGPDAETLFPAIRGEFPDSLVDPAARNGRVRELLRLAETGLADGTLEEPNPLYLRKSDAELTRSQAALPS